MDSIVEFKLNHYAVLCDPSIHDMDLVLAFFDKVMASRAFRLKFYF